MPVADYKTYCRMIDHALEKKFAYPAINVTSLTTANGVLKGLADSKSDLGQNAVHAGIAGRTNMLVGFWGNEFTHVPISMATSKCKKVDPEGWVWNSVLTVTGQPREMR